MPKLIQIAKGAFSHEGRLVTAAKVFFDGKWYYTPCKHIPPEYCSVYGDKGQELGIVEFAKLISQYQCGATEWMALVPQNKAGKPIDLEKISVYGVYIGVSPEGSAPCPGICSYGKIAADDRRINDIEEVLVQLKDMDDAKLLKFNAKKLRVTRKADNANIADLLILHQISSYMDQQLRAVKSPSKN